ncbi:MAG TPA: hypothetical protein VL132_12755, partial [Planctomycetaceae bacterium]|nr:hypothetical protein [Planctomycetaceae bacterium]
ADDMAAEGLCTDKGRIQSAAQSNPRAVSQVCREARFLRQGRHSGNPCRAAQASLPCGPLVEPTV